MKTSDEMTRGVQGMDDLSRRQFVAAGGAAALAATVVRASAVRGSEANSRISWGLIGCGGRGHWIARLFQKHGGYQLAAVADYFQERVDAVGSEFEIPAERRFAGLSGYRQLLASGVDAVVIQSPPYFHPEQAAAAVASGCHVYLAKPVAVDVPGCQSIAESGESATTKGLCYLVDFQTRTDPYFIEAIRRTHAGVLGRVAFGEATYHAGDPFVRHHAAWREHADDAEVRLRAWGLDRALSGDIITEQNIHTLDVMSWMLDAEPLYAEGTCGRTVRTVGTCADHFEVLYRYPNDMTVTFTSRQFDGYGTQPEGIRNRLFGARGVLETEYGGQVAIRGKAEVAYEGGKSPGIYTAGAVANIAAFHQAIVGGDATNPTVAPSVRSNLVTILGREAAYRTDRVSWNDLVRSTEVLDADLTGLKS